MSGVAEWSKCDICGKEGLVLRKYYHYDVKCECCVGGQHFELVKYCNDCKDKVKPPHRISAVVKPEVQK